MAPTSSPVEIVRNDGGRDDGGASRIAVAAVVLRRTNFGNVRSSDNVE